MVLLVGHDLTHAIVDALSSTTTVFAVTLSADRPDEVRRVVACAVAAGRELRTLVRTFEERLPLGDVRVWVMRTYLGDTEERLRQRRAFYDRLMDPARWQHAVPAAAS